MRKIIVKTQRKNIAQSKAFLYFEFALRQIKQPKRKANAINTAAECPLGHDLQKSPSAIPLALGFSKYIYGLIRPANVFKIR